MSRHAAVDLLPHFAAVAAALARPEQPAPTFSALDGALDAVLGHKLFTILRWHADRGESERLFTNQPAAYPVGGRKPLNRTAWSSQVLEARRPYIGRTAEDIRAHFFDHELIASLGCASVLNLPVVHDGRTLGVINLLHETRWYGDDDVPLGQVFAALAVPAFLLLSR